MATFSWSDALHAALDPCLSCIKPSSDNDSTADADALSLHSNASGRKRKSVFPKSITLFGYHLFGRPPIQLPPDDDDDDDGALEAPARPQDAEAGQAEAERAERRRRRERKAAKRAALALAIQIQAEDAFEGFQGSGPAPPSAPSTSSASGSGSGYSRPRGVTSPPVEDDMADFDAPAYSRRAQPVAHPKSARTGSSKKSASSAASYSVPSPSADGFPHDPAVAVAPSEGRQFEGFPDDLLELPTAHAIATFPDLPGPTLPSSATDFPSTGLGGRRSGKSDLGAFLASR